MAVKMKKPDYWPALKEAELLAQGQKKRDEKRRSLIHKEDCIRITGARESEEHRCHHSEKRAGGSDRTFRIRKVQSCL